MTDLVGILTIVLLATATVSLVVIGTYVRRICLRLERNPIFDADASVNVYGEGLVDGIQNAIERGQRGISTYR